MASFNRVILLGRLTRDPESKTFANGGKVCNFGIAVEESKKNPQTGAWEKTPVFIDCAVFNRGENGKAADIFEQYCRKGHLVHVEGKLAMDQWNDKTTGEKRSKLKVTVVDFQMCTTKAEAQGQQSSAPRQQAPARQPASAPFDEESGGGYEDDNGGQDDIPF